MTLNPIKILGFLLDYLKDLIKRTRHFTIDEVILLMKECKESDITYFKFSKLEIKRSEKKK